jgi:hypothetical protein
VWKSIGREARNTAATEGLTETAQEAISVFAEQVAGSTKDLFGKEYMDRFQESFVKGAIGGSAFGVPGGLAKGLAAKAEFNRQQQANETPPPPPPNVPPTQPEQLALTGPQEQLRLEYAPTPEGPAPTELATPTEVDTTTPAPAPAPTAPVAQTNIAKELGMSTRSKAAKTIMDLDLTTPEGVEQLVATVENPSFKGKIEETSNNNL